MKKRGIASWIMEFAGRKKSYYGGSVTLAILGVAASFGPYLLIADVVKELLKGNDDKSYYLKQVMFMGLFWVVRILLHNLSTTLS
ncbi:MAG: ABC transporter ATP-binding protein, partial [Eubacterium sp.]|nr:ABC transporter ATP-binding protein [Eubacterium sp.]